MQNVTFGDRRWQYILKSATFQNHQKKAYYDFFSPKATVLTKFRQPLFSYEIGRKFHFHVQNHISSIVRIACIAFIAYITYIAHLAYLAFLPDTSDIVYIAGIAYTAILAYTAYIRLTHVYYVLCNLCTVYCILFTV